MRIVKYTFIHFVLFISFLLFSQESNGLTLQELVEKSLRQNPALLAERKKIEAIEKEPSQAFALPDPKLSAEWMNLSVANPSVTDALSKGINIGFTQELPYPGKRTLKREEAVSMVKAEKEALRGMEAKVISNVEEAYYNLEYLYKALDILERSKEALTKEIEVAKARYSTGQGILADILKGQTSITELENRKLELNRIQKVTMDQLNSLMGQPPDYYLSIQFEEEAIPSLSDLESLLNESKDAPMIKQVEKMIDVAETRVSIAKKDFKPDFVIGSFYRFKDMSMGGKDYLSVMAGVSLPIFHRKDRYTPALEEAILKRESTGYELENVLIETKYNLSENFRVAKQSKASYDLITKALLTQSEKTLESVSASYSVGKADFAYYLDSLLALYNYEDEAEAMKAETFKAVSRIEGILGKSYIEINKNEDNQ